MALKVGEVNHLIVNRKTDIGYMLEQGTEEVFLHNNESLHQTLKAGDAVDAFLYFDNKGRLAATLKEPMITVSKPGFLKVSDVHGELGVFLDMGIAKEVLLSHEDLPKNKAWWPRVGDTLYVTLKVKGKLVAKIASKQEVKLNPENDLEIKKTYKAYVHKLGEQGVSLLTPDGHFVFVHHTLIKEELRYGQEVDVRTTFLSDKGYSGMLQELKENQMETDAEMIYNYLLKHSEMSLTADSTPEEIHNVFGLSKKAFKRAIGNLYRERKINFIDGKTILVKS